MFGFKIGDFFLIFLVCLLIAGLVSLSRYFRNR